MYTCIHAVTHHIRCNFIVQFASIVVDQTSCVCDVICQPQVHHVASSSIDEGGEGWEMRWGEWSLFASGRYRKELTLHVHKYRAKHAFYVDID